MDRNISSGISEAVPLLNRIGELVTDGGYNLYQHKEYKSHLIGLDDSAICFFSHDSTTVYDLRDRIIQANIQITLASRFSDLPQIYWSKTTNTDLHTSLYDLETGQYIWFESYEENYKTYRLKINYGYTRVDGKQLQHLREVYGRLAGTK